VLRHHDMVMHVPVEVAERAKVSAMTSGLPVVAVSTTYAGSEATAVWG